MTVAENLANKVFNLQKMTGAVPGNIVAAARMIKSGTGTQADVAMIRQYLGISRSGASAMKRGAGAANRALAQSQALSQSIESIAHGEVSGYTQAAGISAKYVEQIVKSPAFKQVLQGFSERFSSGDAAQRIVAGERMGYALRRGARFVQAAAATANVVAEAASVAFAGGDILAGRGKTEATRRLAQDSDVLDVDPNASYADRRLAAKKAAASSIEDLNRGNPLGAIGAWAARKKLGVDAATVGKLETAQILRNSGMAAGLADSLHDTALEEARRSSGTASKLAFKAGIITQELEENTQKNIQNRVESAKSHIADAFEAAGRRQFGLATANATVANKEIPGSVPVWDNIAVYKSQQGDRESVRLWAALNNPRAGARTGD